MKVCIIAHKAYGAFCGGRSGHIGGIEWQTSLLAKWLAQKGHSVSLLTWDEGGAAEEQLHGVRVIKICPQNSGMRGLRFFHPKWSGLVRAMRRADAHVYYQNGCECVTGQAALWCRRHSRSLVFSSASNVDCDARLPVLPGRFERALYRYGLRHADARIVQTEFQRTQLENDFGLDSTVIPMPYFGAGSTHLPSTVPASVKQPGDPSRKRVLWIGRVYTVKRPHLLLDLATACPEIQFDLVGPIYSETYAQDVHQRAKTIPNISVHGPVPRERVASFFENALCLCCTSEFEGFPNTFLEAWSHGLPIVSTFDPDSLIAKRKLGMVVQTVPEMQIAIRSILASPESHNQMSQNARRYVFENHRHEVVLPRFEEVFRSVTQKAAFSAEAAPSQARCSQSI